MGYFLQFLPILRDFIALRKRENKNRLQSGNAYVFSQLSDKLIEQYEKRLAEKDSLIDYLQKEIQQLKTENKGQWAVVSNSKLKTQNSEPSCIIPKKAVPLWL